MPNQFAIGETKRLELIKYAIAAHIEQRDLRIAPNVSEYMDYTVGQLCLRLEQGVYGSADKITVVQVPDGWLDHVKVRLQRWANAKRRDEPLASWLIRKWIAKWPIRYMEIEFHARELFPQIAFNGQPSIVVHNFTFPGAIALRSSDEIIPTRYADSVVVHQEPGYISCPRCRAPIPLKETLRPREAHEREAQAGFSSYPGPWDRW